MKGITHTGIIKGYDARTPSNYTKCIFLRETKLYWISQSGTKYSKNKDGCVIGDWPMYQLDLDSIKVIT